MYFTLALRATSCGSDKDIYMYLFLLEITKYNVVRLYTQKMVYIVVVASVTFPLGSTTCKYRWEICTECPLIFQLMYGMIVQSIA